MQNLTQNLLFCYYLYPKKHNKIFWVFITYPKLYLDRVGVDGVHLSLSRYTLAHQSISVSVLVSILKIHHLLYLSFNFSLNLGLKISLNLGLSLKLISISLKLDAISVSLSKSPTDLNFSHFPLIFSVRAIVSHHVFGFDFRGRGTTSFPLNVFFFNNNFFLLIKKFI